MQFGIRPAETGYRIVYRTGQVNHCPACGGSNWSVGRITAECSFCQTAIPMEDGGMGGVGTFHRQGRTDNGDHRGRFTVNGKC